MGIDHLSAGGLPRATASVLTERGISPVISTSDSGGTEVLVSSDEPGLHARWSHVEIGTSAVVRKRRQIVDTIVSRIVTRFPLPIVYAVEQRSRLPLLENLDYGDAVQIAAEYLVYYGLQDNDRPIDGFATSFTGSGDYNVVIEAMRRAVPSVYEVIHEWNGRCLVVRDLMAAAAQDEHMMLSAESERRHLKLSTHTLFAARMVRFHEMSMPLGLLLPLSAAAAEGLALDLSIWAADTDRTTSHRGVERAVFEYCVRAYLEKTVLAPP